MNNFKYFKYHGKQNQSFKFILPFFKFILFVMAAVVFTQTLAAREPEPERTDWFLKHRYGVFVHYLNGVMNSPETLNSLGRQTSWDDCVNEFDVELFADRMQQAGAGYVIFTMMQQTRFLIAPNETFDRMTGYKPGEACSKRDLVEDLYQALSKRNIDLMLYWTGDAASADPQAASGLKVRFPVTEEFVRNWSDVVAEYGRRYGNKVKGYWVDGCYPWIGYNDDLFKIFAEGLRAGNPDRIIAFNRGVDPVVMSYSVHEDYTCGEQNSFTDVPKSRFLDGEQWHILSYLGEWWGAPGTAKQKQAMADYVHHVNSVGGVVTIDIMLYRDGDVDRSQLEVLKALRGKLAEMDGYENAWKEGKAIPPRNMAWKKLAFLRSNDGKRELIPSVGEMFAARMGNDGDRSTAAIAGGEWAWTYEISLGGEQTVSHVVVHFGKGYPTDVELFTVDVDGQESSFGRFTDQKGESLDVKFEPRKACTIRVRAYKPDGPNQPGTQMSISEIEVYE